jgi:hypothetical protein
MKSWLFVVVAAAVMAAVAVRAEDADHMQAARKDLESARAHLKAAQHDYAGHRRQALEIVEHALREVDDGIKIGDRRDAKDEHKVQQLEHKQQNLEHRIEKLNQ